MGSGFYYGPLSVSAFDIDGCEEEVWEDTGFEIKDKNMCSEYEGYHQEERYNDRGQLAYFKSEALLEMLGEPYVGTVIEIEYTYREDGTLSCKESYYNPFIWGTARSTEAAYYDEQEWPERQRDLTKVPQKPLTGPRVRDMISGRMEVGFFFMPKKRQSGPTERRKCQQKVKIKRRWKLCV